MTDACLNHFFDGLPAKWHSVVKHKAERIYYSDAGTVIFSKHDEVPQGQDLGLVVMGSVAVFVDDRIDLSVSSPEESAKSREMTPSATFNEDAMRYKHASWTKSARGYIGDVNGLGLSTTRTSTVVVASRSHVVEIAWLSLADVMLLLRVYDGVDAKAAWNALSDRTNQLSSFQFFTGTSFEFLYALASSVTECHFNGNEILFEEGDSEDRWLGIILAGSCGMKRMTNRMVKQKTSKFIDRNTFIASGSRSSVDCSKPALHLGTLETGAVFGELSLLKIKRSATVHAGPDGCVVLKASEDILWGGVFQYFPDQRRRFEERAMTSLGDFNFEKVDIIRDWSGKARQCLLTKMTREFVLPDVFLCREQEENNSLYVVRHGTVDVIVQGQTVAKLSDNCIFGELCALGMLKESSASVVTAGLCLVYSINLADLAEFFLSFPQEKEILMQLLDRHNQLEKMRSFPCVQLAPTAFVDELMLKARGKLTFNNQIIVNGEMIQEASVLLIIHGTAEVSVAGNVVRHLSKDDAYGTSELVFPAGFPSCRATVTARSQVWGCFISAFALEELMEEYDQPALDSMRATIEGAKTDILQDTPLSMWNIPFFPILEGNELTQWIFVLDLYRETLTCRAGQTIYAEGFTENDLYVVLHGTLRMHTRSSTIELLERGAVFGEILALGLSQKRIESVTSDSVCQLAVIPADVVRRSLEDLPSCRAELRNVGFLRACTLSKRPGVPNEQDMVDSAAAVPLGRAFREVIVGGSFDLAQEEAAIQKSTEEQDTILVVGQPLDPSIKYFMVMAGQLASDAGVLPLHVAFEYQRKAKARTICWLKIMSAQALERLSMEWPKLRPPNATTKVDTRSIGDPEPKVNTGQHAHRSSANSETGSKEKALLNAYAAFHSAEKRKPAPKIDVNLWKSDDVGNASLNIRPEIPIVNCKRDAKPVRIPKQKATPKRKKPAMKTIVLPNLPYATPPVSQRYIDSLLKPEHFVCKPSKRC